MPPLRTVFYSWQADLDNAATRGLIGRALDQAVAQLGQDASLSIDVRVDRDTAGVAGSPDIAETIFQKIDNAAVFVADVTFIASSSGADGSSKRCPNPNVLVELGWAAKALGWDRVILVMNEHYGSLRDLPFDLPRRRVTTFMARPGDEFQDERRAARTTLTATLREAVRLGLAQVPTEVVASPIVDALNAIDGSRSNRAALVRAAAHKTYSDLLAIAPNLHVGDPAVDAYMQALRDTEGPVSDFARLARRAAEHGDQESIAALFDCVVLAARGLLDPPGVAGTAVHVYEYGYDFWRVITFELHLVLVAPLLAEGQLLLAGRVARLPVVVTDRGTTFPLELGDRSRPSYRLAHWAKTSGAVSPVGRFLFERYAPGSLLSSVVSFAQLADADVYLMLMGGKPPSGPPHWSPYTLPHLPELPRFIANTVSRGHADKLAESLSVSTEDLKQMIRTYPSAAGSYFGPFGFRVVPYFLSSWDPAHFGTSP